MNGTNTTTRTLQQLAQEAINVQNACNPLGLSAGFARATTEVRGYCNSTDELCRHPIFQLWASKMHDLAGMGISDSDAYCKAYDACAAIAYGTKSEPTDDSDSETKEDLHTSELTLS